jgi:hypothetical protein
MKKTALTLLFLSASIGLAGAQQGPDTIAFTLNKQSNICVKARVNQSDTLTLMFHSSASGVTLTRETVEKKLTLPGSTATRVNTWGGTADAQYSEGNSLTISSLAWDSLTVFVNENSGPDTDGKFGYDLFAGKIVAIDYDRSHLVIYPAMPKLPRGFVKAKMFQRRGSLFIPGALKMGKTVYRDTFMFHTGYGGAVLLDPKIGERYAMQTRLETLSASELKDAFGNVFKIETKRLPELRVAGKKLRDVPLSFAARSSPIPMKVFGNGLLKRFNTVLDFQRNEAHFKPSRWWGTGF